MIIVIIVILILILFFGLKYMIEGDKPDPMEMASFKASIVGHSRYEFFLKQYNNAEKKIIEDADNAIKKVKKQMESTSDPIKKLFLQSYIDNHKQAKLISLYYSVIYNKSELTDELDSLFIEAAEEIVTNQKFDYGSFREWFGSNMGRDRYNHIIHQLCDCGILDRKIGKGYTLCVSNTTTLKRIIKIINGKTLLPKDDKLRLNEYFEQRKKEIRGNFVKLSHLSSELPKTYTNMLKAFDALSSCDSQWEIVSSKNNMQVKAYANTLVNRKRIIYFIRIDFNYLMPSEHESTPYFNFEKAGISFYLYPNYVIVARSETDFDVIDKKDFDIRFKKEFFVETVDSIVPKDARFVRYTYKYINKNGEKDARFSYNPRYSVYEYGNITFLPYQLTMQFSNSAIAEEFYKVFQKYKKGEEYKEPNFGATETYFNTARDVTTPLCDLYNKILQNKEIMLTIDNALPDQLGKPNDKLQFLFVSDILKCYKHLGHDATNLYTLEGLPMTILEGILFTNNKHVATYDSIQLEQYRRFVNSLISMNKTITETLHKDRPIDFFYMNEVFKACKMEEIRTQYFSLLYRFFSVIAKADNNISIEEARWLENLISYSIKGNDYGLDFLGEEACSEGKQTKEKQIPTNNTNLDVTNPIEELQSLIGLSEVKEEVSALANFVKIQKEREKKGMKAVGLSYHCVFTGNPGTGKTTVARILAAIYRDLGILKKGHLVETDRSGLVAEYVGQTAVKTNKIIDSALDGVLFIDEAYSLVQGGGNDYGQEAISTLLKRMEDDRTRLIVVLAGYSEDMKRFIDSNPGLQSRFNRYIHFADYTAEELKQIFMLNVNKNQYMLENDGQVVLDKMLKYTIEHKDKNFGNGRYVRNLFEKTIQNQATRLSCQPNITVEDLSKLKAEDLPN